MRLLPQQAGSETVAGGVAVAPPDPALAVRASSQRTKKQVDSIGAMPTPRPTRSPCALNLCDVILSQPARGQVGHRP